MKNHWLDKTTELFLVLFLGFLFGFGIGGVVEYAITDDHAKTPCTAIVSVDNVTYTMPMDEVHGESIVATVCSVDGAQVLFYGDQAMIK